MRNNIAKLPHLKDSWQLFTHIPFNIYYVGNFSFSSVFQYPCWKPVELAGFFRGRRLRHSYQQVWKSTAQDKMPARCYHRSPAAKVTWHLPFPGQGPFPAPVLCPGCDDNGSLFQGDSTFLINGHDLLDCLFLLQRWQNYRFRYS